MPRAIRVDLSAQILVKTGNDRVNPRAQSTASCGIHVCMYIYIYNVI